MRSIRFLGAAGVVTGSKHLLTVDGTRVLVDCGLFQGEKVWRERNWQPLPVAVDQIQGVVLTHAHLDHTGYLPRLAHDGYRGPIYASQGTAELCGVLLPDSGRLQEEDAAFRNRHGVTRHPVALPLYTEADAMAVLKQFRAVALEQKVAVAPGCEFTYHRAAHILGSCLADFQLGTGGDTRRILFTGDIGRLNEGHSPQMPSGPAALQGKLDYLVMESTYGNRVHPEVDVGPQIAATIKTAIERGGTVVIPAFAVERTQKLLFLLKHLMEAGQIPRVPIHLDSPMAIRAVDIFLEHTDEFSPETQEMIRRYGSPHTWPQMYFDQTVEQSKAANAAKQPAIIIASSGMAAGGRVLHHLAQRLPDARNLVIFVGYQAAGTLGAQIRSGRSVVTIYHQPVAVKAQVEAFEQFSDHADSEELVTWLRTLPEAPRQVFLVHGDPDAAAALKEKIEADLHWNVHVAQWLEEVELE